MARPGNDVPRIVCANTIRENEKRLREARIKNQGKSRAKQDLNKFFSKLNQTVGTNLAKTSDKLNLSCHNKNVTNCWYGPISAFPPGSWWGIRMDCSRDRVHDPFDSDIHEGPFGVVSVCTSPANMNEDVDFGDCLTLTGKIYREDQLPSADPFVHNYKNQIPLRLIRSYNLQNKIAPNTGYRYDGLYTIVACWIGVALDGTKYNKFALMRLAHQELPNWSCEISEDSSARVSLNKSNCPNTYDLRRSSYTSGICDKRRFSYNNNNREELSVVKSIPSIDVGRKSLPESSIVTRHVFKKTPSSAESTTSTSVSDRKTTCLGMSTTKTHSTNISIRMGLYESSHNAQDAKKNVCTMLHKPSKLIDITVRAALDIDGIRLIPKEDSRHVARTDADKVRINSRPSENVSYNGYIATDNANETACPLSKRRKNVHSHPFVSSVPNGLDSVEREEQLENTEQSSQILNLSSESEVQKLDAEECCETRNSVTTQEKVTRSRDGSSEPLYAQNIKSLDSLTPDKILNLINKEKHHPLSKLLIGNVIGLTTEEYAMMNDVPKVATSNSEMKTPMSPKINLKRRRKGEDNAKENVACLDNGRHCRYSKSKRLSWRVEKQLDAAKLDKADRQSCNDADKCNNNVRKNGRSGVSSKNEKYLSPLRVQTSLQAIVQHTRSSYDIKTRLRSDKSAVLAKQEFSNSSIKKNKYKKQDREIANLSIDANFGPVTRGPRNRRLRNGVFANKRHHNTFNTVLYPPNKRCKSSFQRKSKLTKVTRARDRQVKERYKVSSALHADRKGMKNSVEKQESLQSASSNDRNDDHNYNNRKKESGGAIVDADNHISKTSFDRNLRKRLAQTVTLSHQTTRFNFSRKKQAEKPSTTDAMTQCRLITDNPEVYVIGQLDDQKAILKMEWDKLAKLKSESICGVVLDDRESEIYQAVRFCPVAAFAEDGVCKDAEFADSLRDKTSAFVPVNAFDSDLRIARLRSIGFKPILEPGSPIAAHAPAEILQNALVTTSKVTKRDVAEEYDKYTNNEDNNMVVYLDDELQYQDIEEEDDENASLAAKSKLKAVRSKAGSMLSETSRENLESPWHGW